MFPSTQKKYKSKNLPASQITYAKLVTTKKRWCWLLDWIWMASGQYDLSLGWWFPSSWMGNKIINWINVARCMPLVDCTMSWNAALYCWKYKSTKNNYNYVQIINSKSRDSYNTYHFNYPHFNFISISWNIVASFLQETNVGALLFPLPSSITLLVCLPDDKNHIKSQQIEHNVHLTLVNDFTLSAFGKFWMYFLKLNKQKLAKNNKYNDTHSHITMHMLPLFFYHDNMIYINQHDIQAHSQVQ